jgi:predicted transcriptional regulator
MPCRASERAENYRFRLFFKFIFDTFLFTNLSLADILHIGLSREMMKMASNTVRIDSSTHKTLQRLSAQTGQKMQEILGEAVELYRRQLFLEKANAAFAALKANQQAWEEEKEERAAWDVALLDGLKDD